MTALLLSLLLLLAGAVLPVGGAAAPRGAGEVGTVTHSFSEREVPGIRDAVEGRAVLLATVSDYVDWVSTLPREVRDTVGHAVDPTYDGYFLVAATQLWCAQETRLFYDRDTHELVYRVTHEPGVVCEVEPGIEIFTVLDDEVLVPPTSLTILTRTS